MTDKIRLVSNLADLQSVIEQVRLDLLSVPLGEFMNRTDDDAVEDFNLIYESVSVVLDESHRAQRKAKKVLTSAPGATVTATAITTVSM